MNQSVKFFLLTLFIFLFSASLLAQGNFSNSIHATRNGKGYWYNANTPAPVPGFQTLTNVPITGLGCVECHPGDNLNANGVPYPIPYPGMGCVDCHATNNPNPPPGAVDEAQCYDCHTRQKTEAIQLGYSDVHRSASTPLKCWDCHLPAELHGDNAGTPNSMFEPGVIAADCEDCHTTLPAGHNTVDPHNGKLHCAACHSQTAISCYNCHFESVAQAQLRRAKQIIHGFVILANRAKDGKVGTMSFQSLTYQGNAWAAFGPYHSHTITSQGRTCAQCHANFGGQIPAIQQFNSTGEIHFATWNSADSTLSVLSGVVPMPENYQSSFKMDFITYNGNPNDPVAPSKNWSYIGKSTWDGHQMFFATPLTSAQMVKIGMNPVAIEPEPTGQLADKFELAQNYPNPFNPSTTIAFSLPKTTSVTLKVYNLRGQEVETLLLNKQMTAGAYTASFNAKEISSGVYVYRLMTPEFSAAKKMVVMK
ncbi:MAG: T9SS type A sorting domain-containing protein [Calditrichaceae bacterium]|nr:T9SS type A sorting domain-containing protein [Calditrichia bacterium]NUQ41463.1 T9SS type A sorting domain-containing protein [Calditrichaceae bacterium]